MSIRFAALLFLAAGLAGRAEDPVWDIPERAEILRDLHATHPRVLLTPLTIARLKVAVTNDPVLAKWHAEIRREAAGLLRAAPSKYVIPDGKRLLATSRRVLDRTQTLGLVYLLDGGNAYRDRLWRELEAAAAFKDWNPSHFLDTSEMTCAFGLAYDWLYAAWTPAQREAIRAAILRHGFGPGLEAYRKGHWWTKCDHNWNQVCNGGLSVGALAIAGESPAEAAEILDHALNAVPLAMTEYGPDGAWAEGPGYWSYATTYTTYLLAALDTALGTDFGLSRIDGFSECGLFPVYATGPTGRAFNYADAHDGPSASSCLYWLAGRFGRPEFAAHADRYGRGGPMALIWRTPTAPAPALPRDRHFRNTDAVFLRGSWTDPQASFVGFKAGDNQANHGHLDIGGFVFDALGYRWAVDLGGDDYNLPAYFGNQRWTYYRLRAEGHNTLVINPGQGPDQDPRARAPILAFEARAESPEAIADLTPAYAAQATKVHRTMTLLNRRDLVIRDEVVCKAPSDIWWFMTTPAKIAIAADGRTATLTQGKAQVVARVSSPEGARFSTQPATPLPTSPNPPGQQANRDVRKLAIHLANAAAAQITVTLSPAIP